MAQFQTALRGAIAPTINKGYLQQLVVVGNTSSSGLESFAYAVGAPWMPLTSSESPYVIVEADLGGVITGIC